MNSIMKFKLNKKNNGFTLMEMLIVVAIIAILVAVSIPVFTTQLDKAKKETDNANVRAAKAIAVAEYLTNTSWSEATDPGTTKYYNAKDGKLQDDAPEPYGKYKDEKEDHTNKFIKVVIKSDGTVSISWVNSIS